MRILNDHFSLLKVNMVLVAFVLALVLIIIAMKLNHQMRYASFLVISTYIICTILQVAIFLAFKHKKISFSYCNLCNIVV